MSPGTSTEKGIATELRGAAGKAAKSLTPEQTTQVPSSPKLEDPWRGSPQMGDPSQDGCEVGKQ